MKKTIPNCMMANKFIKNKIITSFGEKKNLLLSEERMFMCPIFTFLSCFTVTNAVLRKKNKKEKGNVKKVDAKFGYEASAIITIGQSCCLLSTHVEILRYRPKMFLEFCG